MLRHLISGFVFLFTLEGAAIADETTTSGIGTCTNNECVLFEVSVKLDSIAEYPTTSTCASAVRYGNNTSVVATQVIKAGDTCSKQVKVSPDVYASVASVMKSIGGNGTDISPALTPTQQTMLLLYTTLMQQTVGFTCAPRDLVPDLNNSDCGNQANGNGGSSTINNVASLKGVIVMAHSPSMAIISILGVTIQVKEGELMAPSDWTVEKITTTGVYLRRGLEKQYVLVGMPITL